MFYTTTHDHIGRLSTTPQWMTKPTGSEVLPPEEMDNLKRLSNHRRRNGHAPSEELKLRQLTPVDNVQASTAIIFCDVELQRHDVACKPETLKYGARAVPSYLNASDYQRGANQAQIN